MPSDADLLSVGVPIEKVGRFRSLLASALREWLRPRRNNPVSRQGDIIPHLDRLIETLELMRQVDGAGHTAGVLLQAAMSRQSDTTIDDVIEAAEKAKAFAAQNFPSKGAPRMSRTAAPGIDEFLAALFSNAQICGFEWSYYKDRKTRAAAGTLPRLLELLRPHLPINFLPHSGSTLLKHIERVRDQLHPK